LFGANEPTFLAFAPNFHTHPTPEKKVGFPLHASAHLHAHHRCHHLYYLYIISAHHHLNPNSVQYATFPFPQHCPLSKYYLFTATNAIFDMRLLTHNFLKSNVKG
jgi:hypothetical protein